MEFLLGRKDAAWAGLDEALDVCRGAGDALVVSLAERARAACCDLDGIDSSIEQVRVIGQRQRRLDHPRQNIELALLHAGLLFWSGRRSEALTTLEPALAEAQAVGDAVSSSRCAWALGSMAVKMDSREHVDRGLALFRHYSANLYSPRNARWRVLESDLAVDRNDPDGAQAALMQGLAGTCQSAGLHQLTVRLGILSLMFEEIDAVPWLLDLLDVRDKDAYDRSMLHLVLSTAYRRDHRLDAAREHLAQVTADELWPDGLGHWRAECALEALRTGDVDGAWALLEGIEEQDVFGIGRLAAVRVASERGDADGLTRALEAARACPIPRHDRSSYWRRFDAISAELS